MPTWLFASVQVATGYRRGLTAVLFSFGWASTDAETKALGLCDTVFHLSTSDYLLRSVGALYLPAWLAAGVALGTFGLLRWTAGEPERPARAVRVLRFAWAVPLALVPLYPLSPWLFDLLLPLTAIGGFALLGRVVVRGDRGPRPRRADRADAPQRLPGRRRPQREGPDDPGWRQLLPARHRQDARGRHSLRPQGSGAEGPVPRGRCGAAPRAGG
ncbi:hypothetical protein [Streptomyces sp. NPDC020607]|uniref:hypothetical protein n=1 Tax=Streptomyces sp. NPDC020607 TaxID=3365082 RepID=UPI0037A1D2C8